MRIIQFRPSRNARSKKQAICRFIRAKEPQNALDYARQRMGYGHCDLQVLDENWNIAETITNNDLKPLT